MSDQALHDPLGYVAQLQDFLATDVAIALLPGMDGDAPSSERWQAAVRLAISDRDLRAESVTFVAALGFCRLFGTELPDKLQSRLESPLPPELLACASLGLLDLIEAAQEEAHTLPERFDQAEPLEDRSLCTSVLHLLMETWASFLIIDTEYQLYLETVHSLDTPFGNLMQHVLDAFDRLDETVQREEQIALLSIATELPLLENWRSMLVPPYRDPPPWWLDGTLESAAEATRQFIADARLCRLPMKVERPQLTTFLARRNAEIDEQATKMALAASAGEVSGPAAQELLQTTFAITDEHEVSVRLELQPAQNDKRKLAMALVGPSSATRKYASVQLGLRDGKRFQAQFNLGYARLLLSKEDVGRIESLIVVDASGVRRIIELGMHAGSEVLRLPQSDNKDHAMATTDGSSAPIGPTETERRTISYLTDNLLEILRHGTSSVWFERDVEGALASHTYDERIAEDYSNSSGRLVVPLLYDLENLIAPDGQRLLAWLTSKLGLRQAAAEQVLVNLNVRW